MKSEGNANIRQKDSVKREIDAQDLRGAESRIAWHISKLIGRKVDDHIRWWDNVKLTQFNQIQLTVGSINYFYDES